MHVLTVIIANFNCDLIWFNNTDGIHSTFLKSTEEGLAWFSNVIIDYCYHKLWIRVAFTVLSIYEVNLGSICEVVVFAGECCKQQVESVV